MDPKQLAEHKLKVLKASGKPVVLAARITQLPLEAKIETHFSTPANEYLWKTAPQPNGPDAGMYAGIWLSDKLAYVHMVLVSQPVFEYITNVLYKNLKP